MANIVAVEFKDAGKVDELAVGSVYVVFSDGTREGGVLDTRSTVKRWAKRNGVEFRDK